MVGLTLALLLKFAALGIMTRAWGQHMRVGVIQFLKPEAVDAGEVRTARRLEVDWIATGDGFTWASHDLDGSRRRARQGWDLARRRLTAGDLDVLILDEFTYPLHFGWLDSGDVVAWLQDHKPAHVHLVITGRNAPASLVDYADLVTEMRAVKHPYAEQGIAAQPGIEF